jgi:hypothetical protein
MPTPDLWKVWIEGARRVILGDIRNIPMTSLGSKEDMVYTIFRPSARWVDCEVTKANAKKIRCHHLVVGSYEEPQKVGQSFRNVLGMLDHHGNYMIIEYNLKLVQVVSTRFKHDKKYEVNGFRQKVVSLEELLVATGGWHDSYQQIFESLDGLYRRVILGKKDHLRELEQRRSEVLVLAQEASDRGVRFNDLGLSDQLIAPVPW